MAKTPKTPKPPKAPSSKPNPSKGIKRPFAERNRNRLSVIAANLKMILDDLARAPADNASVVAAREACKTVDSGAGAVLDALGTLGADFSVAKPTAKGGAWMTPGKKVRLTAEAYPEYNPERAGAAGAVGEIVEELEVGIAVRFVPDRVCVVRKAHLERADKPVKVATPAE